MDEARFKAFMGKMLGDFGAAMSLPLACIGMKLGLYKAMDGAGPLTSAQLAEKAGIAERYAREWLAQNAASGYIVYHPDTKAFELPEEHAPALAREGGAFFLGGGMDAIAAVYAAQPLAEKAFVSGGGVEWGEHGGCMFCAIGAMLRPRYAANIVQNWLPALDGVVDRLNRGADVADVGCGTGQSTMIMARAFPNSQFVGYDFREPSVLHAREQARGLDNLRFEVATAKTFAARDLDLVTFFDVLHDLGDPVGAAKHVRQALKPDGTFMLMEPMAGDCVEENLGPVSRVAYGFSTMVCVPVSLSQEVGLALGAQAGQKRLTEVLNEGGFLYLEFANRREVGEVEDAG